MAPPALMSQSVAPSREFDFRRSDFEAIAARIYDHAGIVLSLSKSELV